MEKRKSNFEILRILSVFAILIMHSMGTMLNKANVFEIGVITFLDSLLNASSSCLMLLSGYFGIRRSLKKIISLECIVLFWSFINGIYYMVQTQNWARQAVIEMLFPTLSGGHWFVSGYMIIMIFATYINQWIEKAEKRKFSEALILGVGIFYVFPTIFYADFTNTGGKNIIYLLILYLIGRYIKIYQLAEKLTIRKALVLYVGIVGLTFCLNLFAEEIGLRFAFSRDCSVLILLQGILLVVIFEKINIQNDIVNFWAGNIISVILGEQFARNIVGRVMLNFNFLNAWWYKCILEVILVFILCMAIEKIRKISGNKVEFWVYNKLKYYFKDVAGNERIKDFI